MCFVGKTLGENLEQLPGLHEGQQVIMPFDKPIKKTGHIQILYGNLAPEGCVGKITGKEGLVFEGTARCFDSEEDMLDALQQDPNSFKVPLPLQSVNADSQTIKHQCSLMLYLIKSPLPESCFETRTRDSGCLYSWNDESAGVFRSTKQCKGLQRLLADQVHQGGHTP